MMNKRGFLLTILIFLIIAFLIVLGLIYLKVRFGNGLEFRTGNVVIKLSYDKGEYKDITKGKLQNNISVKVEDGNSSLINITSD